MQGCAGPNANTCPYRYAIAHLHTGSDTYTCAYVHADSDGYINAYSDIYSDTNAYSYASAVRTRRCST